MSQRVHVWVQRFADRASLMLQWFDPDTGKRKSRSAKTADEAAAEKARADLEYELNHGLFQERSRLDWERFRERFEEEYLPGLRPRSAEKYITVLDVFETIIKPARIGSITERTLSQFVVGLRSRRKGKKVGLEPITIRNYLIAVKSCLAWAVNQKMLAALPVFPTVRVPKKKPQAVPTESFEKLLAKAPSAKWKAFLLCGWWAGLRLSEAQHLQWERSERLPWVDLEEQRIMLPAEFTKAGQDQWVPLHPTLRQALVGLPRSGVAIFDFRSRKGGGQLSRTGVTNFVLYLAKKAGVKLSMHKLRKGFGCRMAKTFGKSGAAMVHELMRHSSMQVTMDYYANVDDAKAEAIQRLT
jgi:integrase